jgi:PAS domain S-box-containing protein
MMQCLNDWRLAIALPWLLAAALAMASHDRAGAPDTLIPLTQDERAWLAENHTVRVRITDWPPYMITTPMPAGVAVDYIQTIARRFGFKVEFVPTSIPWHEAMADVRGARQYFDLLPTMNRTPEREREFALTHDYLTAPWVVYARNDTPYIAGLESLEGKTLASEQGYAITDKIRVDFPDVRLLEVERSWQALEAVATGRAEAYVGNLAIANYLIKQNRFTNLVVAAPTPYGQHTQAMAVRRDWPALASLINKGLAAIPPAEINVINQKWGAVEVQPRIDYTLLWQVVAGAMLIFLAFFYWNRRLAREVAVRQRIAADLRGSEAALQEEKGRLQQAQHELRVLNQTLEGQVRQRTAQLESANAFNETILFDSPVAMVVYRGSGPCAIVNQAFTHLIGGTRDQLLAQDFRQIKAFRDTGLLDDCLQALADRRQHRREFRTRSSFGMEVWADCLILPILLNGEPHLLLQLFDLTEIRQAGEAMRAAQERAEVASHAKSGFLASMSHEIRTPLNAILGFAQVLGRDPTLNLTQRDSLATIQRSGEHLLTLINDILDMAKIEAGRMTLQAAPFDLTSVVNETAAFFWQRARERGLSLTVEASVPPARVIGDAMRLRQVLINLVGNAVKFTPAGAVQLRVEPMTGEAIRFCISDTGVGITPAEMARLFEPFSQTASGRQVLGGTGLGLALSHQFVKLMGGELTAASTPGQGSCFSFTLSLPPSDAVEPSVAPIDCPMVGLEPDQPVCRVLIVDDLPDNRAPLCALLHGVNPQSPVLECREAADGREAVALWEAWQPHVIFMDMRMPVMSGEEATRRIKACMATRPAAVQSVIVALTASAFDEHRDRFLACGCDEFIRKPFRAAELFAILARRAGLQFKQAEIPLAPRPALAAGELAQHVAALSEDWRGRLREAIALGDFGQITTLAEQLGDRDEALRTALMQWAYNFDLDAFASLFDPSSSINKVIS